jgi:hypothetical protein
VKTLQPDNNTLEQIGNHGAGEHRRQHIAHEHDDGKDEEKSERECKDLGIGKGAPEPVRHECHRILMHLVRIVRHIPGNTAEKAPRVRQ